MNTKKIFSTLLAASLTMSFASAFSAPAMASDSGRIDLDSGSYTASQAASYGYVLRDDSSDNVIYTASSSSNSTVSIQNGTITLDTINPNQTFYIWLGSDAGATPSVTNQGTDVYPADLGDSNLFSMSISKDGDGKSLIKSITRVTNKNYGGSNAIGRGTYLQVVLNDTTTTTDLKANAEITFKARKDSSSSSVSALGNFATGDTLTMNVNMWINNTSAGDNPDTGDRVYFDPVANDTNTLIWGDDMAALTFDADSDTSKFYARLSTKNISDIYETYGDPINADLWFYDFVSNPTVPSTSRATLTLGIPWDDSTAYVPDPTSCYIYQLNANGELTDVTEQFTYSEDDQEIPGWSIRTRQLGTYVLSDTELEIDLYEDDIWADDDSDSFDDVTADTDKVIPDTGSSDSVNVAVTAAILSLAAASAAAFRKATKTNVK